MPDNERIIEKYLTDEARKGLEEEVERIKEEISSGKIKKLNKGAIVRRLRSVLESVVDDAVTDLIGRSGASGRLGSGSADGLVRIGNEFYPVSSEPSVINPSLVVPVVAAAFVLGPTAVRAIAGLVVVGLGGAALAEYYDEIKSFFGKEKEEPLKAWDEFPYISDKEKMSMIESDVTPEMFADAEDDVRRQAMPDKKVLAELAKELQRTSLSLDKSVTDLISRDEANRRYRMEYNRRKKSLADHKRRKYSWMPAYNIDDLITSVFGPPTI